MSQIGRPQKGKTARMSLYLTLDNYAKLVKLEGAMEVKSLREQSTAKKTKQDLINDILSEYFARPNIHKLLNE